MNNLESGAKSVTPGGSVAGHTPGPWGDNNKPVIVRGLTFISHANYETEEGSANARLIAAAPELLEALKSLAAVAEMTTFSDEYPLECEVAYAAISKATAGETRNAEGAL